MDVQMFDCIIVGDSVIYVQAGKAAGIETVSVFHGYIPMKNYQRLTQTAYKWHLGISKSSKLAPSVRSKHISKLVILQKTA